MVKKRIYLVSSYFFFAILLLGFMSPVSCFAHFCSTDLWCVENAPYDQSYGLRAIWGSDTSNIFAVGSGGDKEKIFHYNGSSWKEVLTGCLPDESIGPCDSFYYSGIWGSSKSDIFVVGAKVFLSGICSEPWSFTPQLMPFYKGVILHYDGIEWSLMDVETQPPHDYFLTDVWGSSASDVFAVGGSLHKGGVILHYDGVKWSWVYSGEEEFINFAGIWGSNKNDVFAVGDCGTIQHYDGVKWSKMDVETTPCTYSLTGIWGSSASDVFAVGGHYGDGGGGVILHYDGVRWSKMDSGVDFDLDSVWGASGSDVYAVGDNGTILHYDGTRWSKMDSGTSYNLRDLWGSTTGDVFAVGRGDIILRRYQKDPHPHKLPWLMLLLHKKNTVH